MRILIFADVHANWEALCALQRAEPAPDALLFAGDAVGYGSDPVNCVRWLHAQVTHAVRGDFDEALLACNIPLDAPTLYEAAATTLRLARIQLPATDKAALGQWPLTTSCALGGATFRLAHATPAQPLTGHLDLLTASEATLEAALGGQRADVVILGHTHIPALRQSRNTLFVNPGSLGQPRYGIPDATYAIWEDGAVQIKHLHYNHNAAAQKLHVLPLSPEVVHHLEIILKTGFI